MSSEENLSVRNPKTADRKRNPVAIPDCVNIRVLDAHVDDRPLSAHQPRLEHLVRRRWKALDGAGVDGPEYLQGVRIHPFSTLRLLSEKDGEKSRPITAIQGDGCFKETVAVVRITLRGHT